MSLSEGTGVVFMLLGIHASNGGSGKDFHGDGKHSVSSFLWFSFPLQITLIYLPFLYLPLKGLLPKLSNSQNSLIYIQPWYSTITFQYIDIPTAISLSLSAAPQLLLQLPVQRLPKWISPNLTCPNWTHNLALPNLLLPSPSLAQFVASPQSWLPSLETLAPPLPLPSPLTPHWPTQPIFHYILWVLLLKELLNPSLCYHAHTFSLVQDLINSLLSYYNIL